ncbi:hypothetical protein FN846DRAFT_896663, partial [Sphaerosporella brunnea]
TRTTTRCLTSPHKRPLPGSLGPPRVLTTLPCQGQPNTRDRNTAVNQTNQQKPRETEKRSHASPLRHAAKAQARRGYSQRRWTPTQPSHPSFDHRASGTTLQKIHLNLHPDAQAHFQLQTSWLSPASSGLRHLEISFGNSKKLARRDGHARTLHIPHPQMYTSPPASPRISQTPPSPHLSRAQPAHHTRAPLRNKDLPQPPVPHNPSPRTPPAKSRAGGEVLKGFDCSAELPGRAPRKARPPCQQDHNPENARNVHTPGRRTIDQLDDARVSDSDCIYAVLRLGVTRRPQTQLGRRRLDSVVT